MPAKLLYSIGFSASLAMVILAAPLASAGAEQPNPSSVAGERDVLSTLYASVIKPNLTRLSDSADRLAESGSALCRKPSESALEQARASWREAYMMWHVAKPVLFGPAEAMDLESRLDTQPVHETVLDAVVANDDVEHLRAGYTVRGFGAVEYLLFASENAKQATAAMRCVHLQDVTREIATETARLQAAWDDGFAGKFVSAGDGAPFLVPGDALSLAFAKFLNLTEVMLRDRIGIPSGFFRETIRPEYLAGWRSRQAVHAFEATIGGLRAALVADGTAGFTNLLATKDGLVERRDPQLAADIRSKFEEIGKTLTALESDEPDLYAALQEDRATLKQLYREVGTLQEQLVEASLVLELDVRTPLEGIVALPR